MAFADFLINGSPQSDLGFDAQPGDVLVLELASAPALDSARVAFSLVIESLGAPAPAFDPTDGRPALPTGQVKVTLPSAGAHSYLLQCEVNEGRNARGELDPSFTRQRIVAIRSALSGLRKMLPAESTQYDVRGWSDEQNREVDRVEEALASVGGNIVAGAGLTKTSSTVDVVAADESITVLPDSIAVGVLQTDAQHGVRGGGTLHAVADAAAAGFLSPAHFALLAGASPAPSPSSLVQRGATGEVSATRLILGATGLEFFRAGNAGRLLSPNGLILTIVPAGPTGGVFKLVDQVAGSAKTTDATPTQVTAYALPDACIALVRAEVVARNSATGESAIYERRAGVKRHGSGPATLVGVPQPIGADGEDVLAWSATLEVLGTAVRVVVTGAAATNIDWFARLLVTLYAP